MATADLICPWWGSVEGSVRGIRHRLGLVLLAMVAGFASGCSTVTDLAGIPHPGYQPNGGYVLLASEQALDCRALGDEIEVGFKDMQQAKVQLATERSSPPSTVVGVFGRMFGDEQAGLKNVERYRRSETRVRALNQQLGAKGCHTVDVDARLAALDSATVAEVKPTGSARPAQKANDLQSDIDSLTTGRVARKTGLR